MRAVRAWFARLGELVFRRRRDLELDAEMQTHLQMHIEDGVRSGLAPEEARRQACIALGGVEQSQEIYRDRRGLPALEAVIQDVRFGLRVLRSNPGFTAVAVLTLALGIGANTAVFSVVRGVSLAPLPYRDANRLVVLWESIARGKYLQTDSYQNFRDWQERARSFQEMAAWHEGAHDLSSPGTPEHIDATEVSSNFFATLGVRPLLGRDFTSQQDRVGAAPVVMISNRSGEPDSVAVLTRSASR